MLGWLLATYQLGLVLSRSDSSWSQNTPVQNATRCINETFWSPCNCDDIKCHNGTTDCVDECEARQKSEECTSRAASCPQYDPFQCGVWCWNGLGSCPQCRTATCDILPGKFCHGSPSCCKTDFALDRAAACGYVWVVRSSMSVATTLSVLGDKTSGLISSKSLANALSEFEDYRAAAKQPSCNCTLDEGSWGHCMTNYVGALTEILVNKSLGVPYMPAMSPDNSFDLNCCSVCYAKPEGIFV